MKPPLLKTRTEGQQRVRNHATNLLLGPKPDRHSRSSRRIVVATAETRKSSKMTIEKIATKTKTTTSHRTSADT
jgi:hypothetical protein